VQVAVDFSFTTEGRVRWNEANDGEERFIDHRVVIDLSALSVLPTRLSRAQVGIPTSSFRQLVCVDSRPTRLPISDLTISVIRT